MSTVSSCPGASQPCVSPRTASQPSKVNQLLDEIRAFGRKPRACRGSSEDQKIECALAKRMLRAIEKKQISQEQLQEIEALRDAGDAPQLAAAERLTGEQEQELAPSSKSRRVGRAKDRNSTRLNSSHT